MKKTAKQNKGTVIAVAVAIVGILVILLLLSRFADSPETPLASPVDAPAKTFVKEDFQITLTDVFQPIEKDGFFAFYTYDTAMVYALKEEKILFDAISLEEYGNLVLDANGRTGLTLNKEKDFVWFEYTGTPEKQEICYFVVCCESEDAFWIVNFATPVSNSSQYKAAFLDWASTIQVGQ